MEDKYKFIDTTKRWKLTPEVREKYKPIIQEYLTKMQNLTEDQIEQMENEDFCITLNDTELNPYTLMSLLKEFGYEREEFGRNGWECYFTIDIHKPNASYLSCCESLRIWGCGITFELNLTIREFV